MKVKTVLFIWLTLLLVAGIVGCGQNQSQTTQTNQTVAKIALSPEEITLAPGGSYKFGSLLYDDQNLLITTESISLTWNITGDIGSIGQDGTFTASKSGDGQVTASSGNLNASADITVVEGTPPSDFNLTVSGNQLYPSRTITVAWTASSSNSVGLKKYDIYTRIVYDDATQNNTSFWVYLLKDVPATATSAQVTLPYDGVYDIKVRAVDNNGLWRDSDGCTSSGDASDSSRNLRAEIDAIPPLFFSMSYPGYDEPLDDNDVHIVWNSSQDVNLDYYEVTVGTDSNDVHASAVFSATFEASADRECWIRNLAGGKYYIYLAAIDKAGHYRRIDGKTDIPAYDQPNGHNWSAAWPYFEID